MVEKYSAGEYVITYNGQIYNTKELKEELQEVGFSFSTHSDTEVLLKAYIHYGKNVVNHLNGIFAFAVWNTKTSELFLARDHFGVKPLFYTEIEKGLSGVQSSGATDGGVTSRIFSTILTWMQEKTAPVFVVATANNINQLPPELLRKGRFDEIFFVDLPEKAEREKIFSIHLKKNGKDPSLYALDVLAEQANNFNGAEIEECIKEAMFSAFIENPSSPKLEMIHILNAIKDTVPLSTTMKEQISTLRNWAIKRAKNASNVPVTTKQEEMPILLTRPELELERSFDLNSSKE